MTNDNRNNKPTNDQISSLPDSDPANNQTSKIKIMVVEDDYTTQLLYEKGLLNQVFDKKIVASGKEALQVYNKWHPEIIILDIQLPEMTGDQILREIRIKTKDKKTTIVMATSNSSSYDVKSCIVMGVEGYIVKPFSLREIAAKILNCYAIKEPERAQKASALCQEILKDSSMRLLKEKVKA
jgi:DNA-binding response OmpR family regulator